MSVPDFFRTPLSRGCQRHRRKRSDGRRVCAFGDFDERRRRTRTLAQLRCAMVARENIGVAVGACRPSSSPAGSYQAPQESRTTPGRTVSVTDTPREAGPARVENAHDSAIADAAALSIDGIDRQ